MRLLTGTLFGIGIVWYTYTYLDIAITRQGHPLAGRVATDSFKELEKFSI